MQAIEAEQSSKTEQLIEQLGWTNIRVCGDEYRIEVCPFCLNANHKFYLHVGGEKDGCWDCKVCGERGNYYQLRQRLGVSTPDMVSLKDAVNKGTKSSLPDFDQLHRRLVTNQVAGDAYDYLVYERQLSVATIAKYKLGAEEFDGESWIVIPYFDVAGHPVYYKARSVPPAKKAFRSPAGREAPLFNQVALKPGLEELMLVESEIGCLTLLNQGYESVVGVPGAAIKKAIWIEQLDTLQPKMIYLLYDNDKAGQEGARDIAQRIGLDRVKNIVLPEFEIDGRRGKDVNEWFRAENSMVNLRILMDEAKMFDVAGVQNMADVLTDLKADLEDHGTVPKYSTPWPSLNKKIGGFEDGDLVGVMAEAKVFKTTWALNLLYYYAAVEGHSVLNFCLEMTPKRLVRKLVSHIMQADDTPGQSSMTVEVVEGAMEAARTLKGDILFGYTQEKTTEKVFDIIRQAVRRYGIKVVCFDHLHLLCRSIEHQPQEVGRLITEFKNLAMELGVLFILVIQPNRVAEGQIISARNALGSSFVEKLVDFMICGHRNRVTKLKVVDFQGHSDTDTSFDPHLLLIIDLARFAPGGTCTLYMDGAKSTVRELDSSEVMPIVRSVGIPTEQIEP